MTKPSPRIICPFCGHIKCNSAGSEPHLVCGNCKSKLKSPPLSTSELLIASCLESHAKGKWRDAPSIPDVSKSRVQHLPFSSPEDGA